ncbi:hypothetical protein [Mycobacterium sp. 050134]|uniref:hypothetical protein n=1 Tax=Mycobacterium sp. 050134 TaxID=3096111 RepID=UPI002ED79CBB
MTGELRDHSVVPISATRYLLADGSVSAVVATYQAKMGDLGASPLSGTAAGSLAALETSLAEPGFDLHGDRLPSRFDHQLMPHIGDENGFCLSPSNENGRLDIAGYQCTILRCCPTILAVLHSRFKLSGFG